MNYTGYIQSKLPDIKTSIFTLMSALAKEENAINLSQGFPDFSPHPKLIEATHKAMKAGFNQYAPMAGLMELREKISEKVQNLYHIYYNPEKEITITAGATQAIFTIITALIKPKDEVIIIEPAYDSYAPAVKSCGGMVKYLKISEENFSIPWEYLSKLITAQTKAIIINTPHNPTGSILKKSDLIKLNQILENNDIILISDEVYEHIIFDNEPHQSVALYPKLAKKTFIVSSFGKTYHCTGWKVGYVLAPENLMTEFRKVHQYNVFSVHTPTQVALAEILPYKDLYLGLGEFYQEKRDYFRKLLAGSRFEIKPVAGSYFQVVSYEHMSEKSDIEFAQEITKKYKVAPIPLSVFYKDASDYKQLRFCFAKENETLEKAAEKLMKI